MYRLCSLDVRRAYASQALPPALPPARPFPPHNMWLRHATETHRAHQWEIDRLVDGFGEDASHAHAPRIPFLLGIHGMVWGFGLTWILTPSCVYIIHIGYEVRVLYSPPLPHPPVFLPKVTRIFGPFLLVDGRVLRPPATHFYWSTCGENPQLDSICWYANHWGVSVGLIPSEQGLYMPIFFIFLFLTR